jgi:hypothetical protein
MVEVMEREHKQVTPEQKDAINAFEMPKPLKGQSVMWWPHGSRQEGYDEIAHVLKVNGRNVKLRLGDGRVMQATKHVNDPKLKLNESQREDGCWDFTDADRYWRDEASKLTQAVAELTKRVTALEGKKKGE